MLPSPVPPLATPQELPSALTSILPDDSPAKNLPLYAARALMALPTFVPPLTVLQVSPLVLT